MKSILLAAALACAALPGAAQAANPKPASPKPASAKPACCPCACPHPRKTAKAAPVRKAVRHAAVHRHHHWRDYAYDYDAAEGGWWGGPVYYGPPPGYGGEGMTIDTRGFTGGVGYGADGGAYGGGGFVDGYGQVHYASGNGPTYNSYGQSFQYNPSRPGPFVPQRMGMPAR